MKVTANKANTGNGTSMVSRADMPKQITKMNEAMKRMSPSSKQIMHKKMSMLDKMDDMR